MLMKKVRFWSNFVSNSGSFTYLSLSKRWRWTHPLNMFFIRYKYWTPILCVLLHVLFFLWSGVGWEYYVFDNGLICYYWSNLLRVHSDFYSLDEREIYYPFLKKRYFFNIRTCLFIFILERSCGSGIQIDLEGEKEY